MIESSKNGLSWLTAANLNNKGVIHAFTTRRGGISEGSFASLNLSYTRGDETSRVEENFRILARAVGYKFERLVASKQVHGDVIRIATESDCGKLNNFTLDYECDALITDIEGLPLMVFSADCVPILLFDPVRRAIGAVHTGWRGTALGIAAKTVRKMAEVFGCKANDIVAAIGPCIDKCCFETERDVPNAMAGALPEPERFVTQNGLKYSVDLKEINRYWLESEGVTDISVSDLCTACNTDLFWSHRVQGDNRGSMASVIML